MAKENRNRTVHVVPKSGGGWAIRKEGAEKASSTHATKDEAVARARVSVRDSGKTEIVIHSKSGLVVSRDTVGRDPTPPKEKDRRK